MATLAEERVRQSYLKWAIEALSNAQEDYQRYEDYYVGDHKLEFATDRWKEVFENEFEQFSDNWCQVVVDAPVQRLEITGWRSEDNSEDATDAEQVWDDNVMEIEADDVHTQAFVKGDAYLMVWRNPDDPDQVDMYYQDAADMAVTYSGSDRRVIIRAAKRYQDDNGDHWVCLYFPDHIEKWVARKNVPPEQVWISMNGWDGMPAGYEKGEPDILNPYGQVPVFHFKNRASGRSHGVSELKAVIPVQNAVNKLMMDMMVGSEFGSYRQKWMAGAGHPKDGWKAGPMRMWATTDANAKFGEFGQIDLESLVRAIDLAVGHIAKITQTPLHYLRSSGDMPSGEALKTSESGLVKKCYARHKVWGAPWTDAMTFALTIKKGSSSRVAPVWESPETRHHLEQVQTGQLKSILGVPLEIIWAELGYDEEQIQKFKEMNKAIAASMLALATAQPGQVPPELGALSNPQVLALLGKGQTSQTTAGEATTSPQANTRPPASPTRRSTGFKD